MLVYKYKGKAVKFSDNIDTDAILPGKYLTLTDERLLAPHAFEGLSKFDSKCLLKSTVIVAGKNFGCGSSREGAPLSIKGNGIKIIIAESFARIFYRNSINIGLIPVECEGVSKKTRTGDIVEINLNSNEFYNKTRNIRLQTQPLSNPVKSIIESGGLIPFIKAQLKEGRKIGL